MPSLEWVELFFRIPLCCPPDAMINKGKTSVCVKDTFGLLRREKNTGQSKYVYVTHRNGPLLCIIIYLLVFVVNPIETKMFENKYWLEILVLRLVFYLCLQGENEMQTKYWNS